jgi:hypothetical protein
MTKSKGVNRPRHVWTPEQDALLRDLYSNTLSKDIALQIGVRLDQVYGRADALGLKKADGFLSSAISGQFRKGERPSPATQFKPGHKPWSAGKKIGTRGRAAETQFKPGEQPINYTPVGTVRITKDGYQILKVSDTGSQWERWKFIHRLTWEFIHGEIPHGQVVAFKDFNRMNCSRDNLILLTREQNILHSALSLPPELREVMKLKTRIKQQITKRERNEKQEHA